jgi:sugar phosphate isomerase/epimerase
MIAMPATRREFLIASTLTAAAARIATAAAPSIRFPAAPRDRLALASYSLRTLLDTPRNRARDAQARLYDIKDIPKLAAERFHLNNVELLGQHLRSTEPAYLEEVRAAVKSAGSHIVNIPTSVGGSLYDADSAKRSAAVASAKKWIDTAGALECPSVRIHIQGVRGVTPDAGRTVESLGPIAEHGAAHNVVVNLENDDLVSEDALFLVKVIDQVNTPWLRALPDFCNSAMGGDEKFNYEAVAAMFRRAYNICHMKDSEVDQGKVVRIDVERTFGIAKTSGYKGYFSIEFEGEGEPLAGVEKLIAQSLKYLG